MILQLTIADRLFHQGLKSPVFGGNLSGNLRQQLLLAGGIRGYCPGVYDFVAKGRHGHDGSRAMVVANQVRTYRANRRFELAGGFQYQVRTGLRTSVGKLAPTGISRALGVREDRA